MDNADNSLVDSPDAFPGNQPGSVITPTQRQTINQPQPPNLIRPPLAENTNATTTPESVTSQPDLVSLPTISQPTTNPLPIISNEPSPVNILQEDDMSWVAPEFVERQKNSNWRLMLAGSAVVLGVIIYFLTRDAITAGMIIFVIFLTGVYGMRKPKEIEYSIGRDGVSIGPKRFDYDAFRAFTAAPEGNFTSITFVPLKRFAPPVGLCVFQKDEEFVLNFLADRLPYEDYKPDFIERFMEIIHF